MFNFPAEIPVTICHPAVMKLCSIYKGVNMETARSGYDPACRNPCKKQRTAARSVDARGVGEMTCYNRE